MTEPTVLSYASSGGVVLAAKGDHVLTLLRPQRLDESGRPEVRLPKGHIAEGESRVQAALREVGEEAGLYDLRVLADLGHQIVEYDWLDHHYVRDESCFLLMMTESSRSGSPEAQFERLWLPWDQTMTRLTYGAEKVWIRRAWQAALEIPKP